MADRSTLLEQRRFNPVREPLSQTGLYHSFQLPDGTYLPGSMPLDWQRERLASFRLSEDLSGKRALDIGPWDGFYTFELERRGADTTAIDYVDLDTFRALHRAFNSRAHYLRMDVYELDPRSVGLFDIVLCLGTLYHFKHPLLALERICAVTKDICIIDTVVIDGREWKQRQSSPIPRVEFYERDELGGQLDNWCGPTVSAVEALARAAGFARTEVLRVTDDTACIAAHRRWPALAPDDEPAPELTGLTCHLHRGRCFISSEEEYIQLWCAWQPGSIPLLDEVFPEVDGFGVSPMSCTGTETGIVVNLRVPPGLSPGAHYARLKIGRSCWSSPMCFYVDLPPIQNDIRILAVQDAVEWQQGEVHWIHGGWAAVWVEGLSEEADEGTTVVEVAGIPHYPEAVAIPTGQINIRLRPVIQAGEHSCRVLHRGAASQTVSVKVIGTPPVMRGLERLAALP